MSEDAPTHDGAPQMLLAELLFEQPPTIDRDIVASYVSSRLPETRLSPPPRKGDFLLFTHDNHVITYDGGEQVPAQVVVIPNGRPPDPQRLNASLRQTWEWPEAKQEAPRWQSVVVVNELMARLLDHRDRVTLFQNSLLGVVEATNPLAIHSVHAERLLSTGELRRASGAADPLAMAMTAMNVRLFRIEDRPGEMVMDTRGLASLGLPDVHLHFRGLEPGHVAGYLYGCARYIYEQGDCINDGETIAGITGNERWRCQHETALVGPKRVVLDIDPGGPYAAGNRYR